MNGVHCQLWMGNLESYMTENFVLSAFRQMGEDPQTVRLMRNRLTNEPAGYCFVNFQTDEQALDAMHKLNGKPIPGTNPVVRFRLNNASNSVKLPGGNEREFSVWVGDLSLDVDDYSLYRAFADKYTSIKTAKVILDTAGFSKGYGFVRFGIEDEQLAALSEMNGWLGLGTKALKICNAVPRPRGATTMGPAGSALVSAYGSGAATNATEYALNYDPATYCWPQQQQWNGYESGDYSTYYHQQHQAMQQQQLQQTGGWTAYQHYYPNGTYAQYYQQEQPPCPPLTPGDDLTLVEHKFWADFDQLNQDTIDSDLALYDALERSKWHHVEPLEQF